MFGITKTALRSFASSRIFYAALLIVAAITVLTTSTLLSIKTVTVTVDGEKTLVAKSLNRTVGDFISRQNIEIGSYDSVSPPIATLLKRDQTISVLKAFPVKVVIGAETTEIQTTEKVLSNVLDENGIIMDEMDIVNPSLDSVVSKDTVISIIKVTADMVPVIETVPFETISTPNSNLERGKKKVITEGVSGTKELMYNVVYHDGVEASRELVGERILQEPQNKVEQYGTQYYELSSRGGRVIRDSSTVENPKEQLNFTQELVCTATAYDLSFASCGKNPGDPYYGIAASGMKISRGVVAVDPRVIPMGSKLYIQSMDSWPDYGFAIAGDKGGAIKGNKVDLFMETASEVSRFGRRKVKVYILEN